MSNQPTLSSTPLPLEPGDRLSREEFERRYNAMPHLKKAELIEGVVFLTTSVRHRGHAHPHVQIVGWLGQYEAATPGTVGGDGASVRLDPTNEFQPDVVLLLDPTYGGQSRISDDDFIELAPELVCEVCSSSAGIELHTKREVYRRVGVQEYLVWRVAENALDWFVLRDESYVRLQPDDQGIRRSVVFPGLWLDVQALLSGDMERVVEVGRQGIASDEHAAFVQLLHSRRS